MPLVFSDSIAGLFLSRHQRPPKTQIIPGSLNRRNFSVNSRDFSLPLTEKAARAKQIIHRRHKVGMVVASQDITGIGGNETYPAIPFPDNHYPEHFPLPYFIFPIHTILDILPHLHGRFLDKRMRLITKRISKFIRQTEF